MTVLMIEKRTVIVMIAGNFFIFIFFPSLQMMIEVTMRWKDE